MNTITREALEKNIETLVEGLLNMAKELTWNKISPNCKFILSEIKDMDGNFHDQRLIIQKENNRKNPVSFSEIIPVVLQLYPTFYDINLHVYKAKKRETIIDIRYYSKFSLDSEYRETVMNKESMLHAKQAMPPWLPMNGPKPKFDINWEHKHLYLKWRMYLERRKLKRYK